MQEMEHTRGALDALLQRFMQPSPDVGPYICYAPADTSVSEEEITRFTQHCAQSGIRCLVPRLQPAVYQTERQTPQTDEQVLDFYRRVYRTLLSAARGTPLQIAFSLEQPLEKLVVRADADNTMRAQLLVRRDYYMSHGEEINRPLARNGHRMSIVAVDQWDGERIDLRPFVNEQGTLTWTVPSGNWCAQEFLCCEDAAAHVDYLSRSASLAVLRTSYAHLSDLFLSLTGAHAPVFCLTDIAYHAPNHRNWSPDFNRVFMERYGIDPAPWYPLIYDAEDDHADRIKAMLFSCRAEMLKEGIYRAIEEFCGEHGMTPLCCVQEPKLSAPSGLSGDVVGVGSIAPGAMQERRYLYGLNSLKIAAAGTDNYGCDTVSCHLYRDYATLTPDILYQDAINALVRGSNLLVAHADEQLLSTDVTYVDFVRRAQALLRGGRHVCDVAMMYPIYSLHSSVSFYEATTSGFEYPDLPGDIDYTTLINALSFYAGRDVSLLHPDVLSERGSVRGNQLVLSLDKGENAYRVLILPASRLLCPRLMQLVRRFFEAGGKIIATGERLATRALVPLSEAATADAGLREDLCAVFGEKALDPDIVAGQQYHRSEAGGEAYWLCPDTTAADGTMMVSSARVARVLYRFEQPFDVYIPNKPRHAETGVLGNPYSEFSVIREEILLPLGGMLEYLHKQVQGCEVYFFGNSATRDFEGEVLLRGRFSRLMLCDPKSGEVRPLTVQRLSRHGCVYSRIELSLPALSSCFVLAE